ncbi:Poly-beta-1,6-N-acetyl-D-glucosamine synthase [Maioricimonas rarisocia]|uniref:Poly-beta-1,6-N-acetyl-D-glucosamine synthase n=1 Tax=Maioricimonas rarisocia TaxID=2528026 RepID=A0A517ZF25_9PLAN|nr:glycosyltransferase family 2 protein [Maioricimonas rarisocia]QDU41078.1 Poly-beta-1,6-N-acetyl-D-glucosamine synthase [Maioricimonas rarisocia]
MIVWQILFWTACGLTLYCYAGYPFLLALLCKRRSQRPEATQSPARDEWPMVSLVIAAYREEAVIMQRLNNALLCDYPADRLEILIGCDGNEDATGELVRSCPDSRVRLLQFDQRRGKPSVLNDCVAQARGDILVFSDANTFFEPDAIRRLIAHFDDAEIGGVCGKLLLVDPETGGNVDGLYWRYENFLKECEGRLGALLGVNGAIYAMRRSLYQPIPPETIVDDFLIGMRIHLKGSRLTYDPAAIATEESAPGIDAEFHRRARIGAGGFQSLVWLWPLLSPTRGRVALAFWSHKVLRWFCPLLLVVALASNVVLINQPLYQVTFALQLAFYCGALLGRFVAGGSLPARLSRLPTMFVSMNAALLVGFVRWLRGQQKAAWKRTDRTDEMVEREPAGSA